jgi:hypothetical protein
MGVRRFVQTLAGQDAVVEPIWTADTRQSRRLIAPALVLACVGGGLTYVLSHAVGDKAADAATLGVFVGGSVLVGYLLRFVWWICIVARR